MNLRLNLLSSDDQEMLNLASQAKSIQQRVSALTQKINNANRKAAALEKEREPLLDKLKLINQSMMGFQRMKEEHRRMVT